MQSMFISTKVVSSNPAHGEVFSIQHYVIKFVSYLRQVGGFLAVFWFPLVPNKPDRHDIAEILLPVVLNTITLTLKTNNCNEGKFRLDFYSMEIK